MERVRWIHSRLQRMFYENCSPLSCVTLPNVYGFLPVTCFLFTMEAFQYLHGSPYSLVFLKDRSCLGQWRKSLSSCKVCFLGVSYHQVKPRVLTEFTASSSIISIMLSQPKTKKAFQFSTPKGIIIPQREKPGHIDQKEDELQNEATILGVSPPHYKEDTGEILQMCLI